MAIAWLYKTSRGPLDASVRSVILQKSDSDLEKVSTVTR